MLSYQKYKLELEKAAEKKTKSNRELKRKQKFDEIEGFEKETLEADKNQDLGSISKAASFLCTIKEKEKTQTELM